MKLYAFVTTPYMINSPRKTHIIDEDGNVLCGCSVMGLPTVEATSEWVNQPDYYGELCKTCKKIANKKIGG